MYLLLIAATAAAAKTMPELELHYNVSNIAQQQPSRWVVKLSSATPSLAACGALCAAYENASNGAHLSRCQSFTRFAAGGCLGRVDPRWLPLSGVKGGVTVADSGMVLWPCASAFDCSHNGQCGSGGMCTCSQGWTGRRCQALDLLPVDRSKYGFSPQDSLGQNLSSWGGSVLSNNGVWHMWAARMVNYCGIGMPHPENRTSDTPLFAPGNPTKRSTAGSRGSGPTLAHPYAPSPFPFPSRVGKGVCGRRDWSGHCNSHALGNCNPFVRQCGRAASLAHAHQVTRGARTTQLPPLL